MYEHELLWHLSYGEISFQLLHNFMLIMAAGPAAGCRMSLARMPSKCGQILIASEAKSPWTVALITLMHDFAAICNLLPRIMSRKSWRRLCIYPHTIYKDIGGAEGRRIHT